MATVLKLSSILTYFMTYKYLSDMLIMSSYMCILQFFVFLFFFWWGWPNPSFNTHFCRCFREGFATVLQNVLKLAEGKSPLAKQYTDAKQDAVAEDLPGSERDLIK